MTNRKQYFFKWMFVIFSVTSVACSAAPEIEEVVVTREVIAVTVENQPVEVEVTRVVTEVEVVEVTVTPQPTEQALPQSNDLTICGSEPETLYIYNGKSRKSEQYAIYTNDYTNLSFAYQAEGLEKLPSLHDGDAVVHEVAVETGDTVVDAAGIVVVLAEGMNIKNTTGETVAFSGEPVMMEQMVVDFTLKQRFWSDGTPVTADDSVYSYEIAADPDTPVDKFVIGRTANYETLDELSARWTGVPGYLDATFFTNFWQPLPRHAWAEFSAADLLESVEVSRKPMGDGAFMVEEWVIGDFMRLVPNPYYYRADEGLPYLDSITFKYIENDPNKIAAEVLAGNCDIAGDIATIPFLLEAEANDLLVTHFQGGIVFEHIDFGINSYGENGDGIGRPDWFEDVRVRQAMTMCTDRQGMVDDIFYGTNEVIHSYIPDSHLLNPEDLIKWPYDVELGNTLLDEVGFMDTDADGWREDPTTGVPFQVDLIAAGGGDVRRRLVETFKENMIDCGIDVQISYIGIPEFYADGPDGPIFGRQFDLGEFPWFSAAVPPCHLFLSDNITGPLEEGYGGWNNFGNTGWGNEAFDTACNQAMASIPGTIDYEEGHQTALKIFAQELPIIPLFQRIHSAATRPDVLNFRTDPTAGSLYNIYELDLQR